VLHIVLRAVAAVSVFLLIGCAAPYVPYTGSDASKLRLTLANGGIFSSAASNIRPVHDGKCGETVLVPQLFPYFGPRPATQGSAALYPRADMVGSPDPQRSDTVELKLTPGRYALAFIGGIGRSNCSVGGGFDLLPGRQYHVDFRFDTLARQCVITLRRLDDAGALAWHTQPFLKGEMCKGS
jgi:hypothetical protein